MTVRWSHTAQDDLDQIYAFIAENNPNAAARMQDKLLAAGESLDLFPGRGRPGRTPSTRELVLAGTPYLIVHAEGSECDVIHGAQLWPPAGYDR